MVSPGLAQLLNHLDKAQTLSIFLLCQPQHVACHLSAYEMADAAISSMTTFKGRRQRLGETEKAKVEEKQTKDLFLQWFTLKYIYLFYFALSGLSCVMQDLSLWCSGAQ